MKMRLLVLTALVSAVFANAWDREAAKEEIRANAKVVGQVLYDMEGKPMNATLSINSPNICDPNVRQYSGYFQLGGEAKQYFFWFFESRNAPTSDPTIMWLTGGPGCSSQLAIFAENGPCKVNHDGKTTSNNPYSWNSNANVLWVDQPPGTGFSKGTFDHNEQQVGVDMYYFLQAFFGQFPSYNKNFFVFGESYGGHYVPSVAYQIWLGNQTPGPKVQAIDMKGFAIGNGLTDPEEQYKWYPEMAYNPDNGLKPVVSKRTYNLMKLAVNPCVDQITSCNNNKTQSCVTAYDFCNRALIAPYEKTGLNPYDMRIKCQVPGLCYDFSNVTSYLNQPSVQKALGVDKQWESCNMAVNKLFVGDWMHDFQWKIPPQLASGIRVLIYAGDVDFICNYLGNKNWAIKLEWPGKEPFTQAGDAPWSVGGKQAGKLRKADGQYGQFSFLQVLEAGHMVPMDQPAAALQMVNQFITNTLNPDS